MYICVLLCVMEASEREYVHAFVFVRGDDILDCVPDTFTCSVAVLSGDMSVPSGPPPQVSFVPHPVRQTSSKLLGLESVGDTSPDTSALTVETFVGFPPIPVQLLVDTRFVVQSWWSLCMCGPPSFMHTWSAQLECGGSEVLLLQSVFQY